MANYYLKDIAYPSRFEYYQVIYWVCYTALTFTNNSLMANPYRWWEVLLTILFVMAIVYSIVYVFLLYLKPLQTLVWLIAMFGAYALLFYLLAFVWHKPLGVRILGPHTTIAFGAYVFTMFLHWYHSMVGAGLLAAIYRIRRNEQDKRKLLEEKHQIALQFLMAQIEPHEQYNMLDVPYALALQRDKEIADALLDYKAYSQYVQAHAKHYDGEVCLAEELEHCQLIIHIHKRRFEGRIYVEMQYPEGCGDWKVPALSISALLKNAFKYGISWDAEKPILLQVACNTSHITITVRNAINPNKTNTDSTGIGNENIQQRLHIMYGEQASLTTRIDEHGWYEAKLTRTKNEHGQTKSCNC